MKAAILVVACLAGALTSASAGGTGLPSRDPNLDVMPGFRNPPPGYGEVPFWWWTGDKLDVDRMIGQLKKLHAKGISGVQVNYSHYDSEGWLTDQDPPSIFSDEWWDVYSKISQACSKLDMGIGLSTYTLDWPRGATNLFYQLFYRNPELNAIQLEAGERVRVRGGQTRAVPCLPDQFAARAYKSHNKQLARGGVDLAPCIKDGTITWTAPEGDWEIWRFRAVKQPGSMNPLMRGMGETVIRGFFQRFEDHNPGKSSKGLNYFFNDELHIGVGKFAWNPDFPEEFARRKGYALLEVLPAMWSDMGDVTPKVLMDYADVRMSLMEERYFKPVYEWHNSRGMIFACDSGGRGTDPHEFGDYFRVTRWYSAPGHDTPGGQADLIKGKVSSSIANLYGRERVWLEGYHSMGWGATPERLLFATRENYLYGCTLLNLHGLYYTTYGSYWEWAPPCYHFRMPYWDHMGAFLDYFKRLSYLLSQGHTVADLAIVYPVAPFEAELNGAAATQTAFDLARQLMAAGISFEFIDNDSLARAEVVQHRLVVKDVGVSYQALVMPNMEAVRWPTIQKAALLAEAGGKAYCVGALPRVSDRAGRNDPELAALNDRAFAPSYRPANVADAIRLIRSAFVQDVVGLEKVVRCLHRKVGPRDVYMVMDARPYSVVEFRAKGAVELLDPWTGTSRPLPVVRETATGTQVELPLEAHEAQVVLFTPGKKHVNPPPKETKPEGARSLPDRWSVSYIPTMDNTHGDFRITAPVQGWPGVRVQPPSGLSLGARLPAGPEPQSDKFIGLEARRFAWAQETPELATKGRLPETDDQNWEKKLHGCGTQFYVLGPVPQDVDAAQLDAELSRLPKIDPGVPVKGGGKDYIWRPYDISWRYGKEGDSGHQGYHGLKRTVTDDFLCLGKAVGGLNETRYLPDGGRYYLWTAATVPEQTRARIAASQTPPEDKSHTSPLLKPAAVYVSGKLLSDSAQTFDLSPGSNPILVRYDEGGRGHFVLRRADVPRPKAKQPLAMWWYGDPGLIPFDVSAGAKPAEWFRFLTAPGTSALTVYALGHVEAWIDGKPMKAEGRNRFMAPTPAPGPAVVALRIEPETGYTGGALIPDPIAIETREGGMMPLGDWSKMGILNNYSGGVRYRTRVSLSRQEARSTVTLDLGKIAGTAEVHVNHKKVGLRVAPPWKLDVTGFLKTGENTFEVLVYNTLANHYQTIPSNYRGDPVSGLLGPVRLLSRDWPSSESGMPNSHATGVRVEAGATTLAAFNLALRASNSLARHPGVIKIVTGTSAHDGGGSGFGALFNGTAGNGEGGEETQNDGKTFVGFAEGNTLEIQFDPVVAPAGVTIDAIRTCAGHADARASQAYEVFASAVAIPDQFVRLADVNHQAVSGLTQVSMQMSSGVPLATNAAALRLVFKNGPLGFNVYREINFVGHPAKPK